MIARIWRGTVRADDADAYEELVHAYQGIALRTAYLLAGNAADAEEAAQDAFVKAYRALWRFRAGAPFKPWLLRIVANEARNRRRSAGRRSALVLRVTREAPGEAAPSPEATVLATERREELIAANHSVEEIARRIGVDSLGYLSLEGMLAAVPDGPTGFCHACFSGEYPTAAPSTSDKLHLVAAR